ncbi:unnamed protein product [Rotaria sordida]|uniref:Mos1 transposase HTH domain-containing protein n=2 Tax=Rotaria sordida TaxID=392033 RepID=A0A819B6M5_9BILA|nr:unnamed protein product [Rotaria sordida]
MLRGHCIVQEIFNSSATYHIYLGTTTTTTPSSPDKPLSCLAATQIHDELATTYRQGVVSYCTVANWVHRFSSGCESLEDDP